MTTSLLPLRLGTARLGTYVEPGAEAPKHLRVHGQCWQLVTDPLFDIALVTENGDTQAQEAFAARLAHILHLSVENLIVTEGAVVNELVAERIAVAVARVIQLDADRITSGTIDTARLNATAIAAAVATIIEIDADRITSGTIDTDRLRAQEVAGRIASFLTLEAGQIVTGTLDTARLNASEIAAAVATIIELNADRITTGTLDAARIAAHSITVGKILVDEELAAEIVSAMDVATKRLVVTEDAILNRATVVNGLAADVVAAATIYASQLVVSALDENGDLTPDSVGTVQIVDGAVRAAQIHAEEVAGAVARFLTIEVGQLVAGDADVDSLVAQKIAGATADFQEAFIQNLRSNGAQIDEAVISVLAANIITSGLFRTASSGQRLEIDSNGLVMWGVNADGIEYEVVRLGPSGENLLTIGESTISEDSMASPRGAFGDLTVGGQSVDELLATLPRGMVAWGQLTTSSQFDGHTGDYARRGEIQTFLLAGRLYRIRLSEHFVEVEGSTNTNIVTELRYSFDGDPIYHGLNPSPGNYQGVFARSPVFAGSATTVNGLEFMLDTGHWNENHGFWLMWMMRPELAGRPVKVLATSFYSPLLSVEDVGPSMPPTLKRWNDGDGGGSADPDPIVRRQVKTYTSTGHVTYNSDGSNASKPDATQGLWSGGSSRFNRRARWIFPDMTGDLSGATIEKIEMYIYMNWSWASAGATVNPAVAGTSFASISRFTTVNGWSRNSGRWITLPASYHAGFQSGQYRGVGVIPTSTSPSQYALFNGGSGARIRITFRK